MLLLHATARSVLLLHSTALYVLCYEIRMKKERVVLYVKPNVKALLEHIAANERRTVSEYMEPLLDKWYSRTTAEQSPLAKAFAPELPKQEVKRNVYASDEEQDESLKQILKD